MSCMILLTRALCPALGRAELFITILAYGNTILQRNRAEKGY
jgi:hypothetical protein